MGQDITVTKLKSSSPKAHVYSLNRSLTGMEILNFDNTDLEVDPNNAAKVLAKKLLELGVEKVSVYSNVVTITCDEGKFDSLQSQIESELEGLFRFYSNN